MTTNPTSPKKRILIAGGIALAILGWVFVGNFIMNNFTSEGSNSKDCEKLLYTTVTSVPGVESATVVCSLQFGGGWQRQDVSLDADTESEALLIVENILKAYAYQNDMPNTWRTPQVYRLKDGSTLKSLPGFNGVPDVGDVRSYYKINP